MRILHVEDDEDTLPSDVASALASGAQGYLEKPCTPDALIEEILKLSQR